MNHTSTFRNVRVGQGSLLFAEMEEVVALFSWAQLATEVTLLVDPWTEKTELEHCTVGLRST